MLEMVRKLYKKKYELTLDVNSYFFIKNCEVGYYVNICYADLQKVVFLR